MEILIRNPGLPPDALAWANSSVRLSARLITGRSTVQIRVGPLPSVGTGAELPSQFISL